jgi:hypothetical protein
MFCWINETVLISSLKQNFFWGDNDRDNFVEFISMMRNNIDMIRNGDILDDVDIDDD